MSFGKQTSAHALAHRETVKRLRALWFIAVCKYHTRTNTHERARKSESLYAAGALSQPITCAEHKSKGRLYTSRKSCWRQAIHLLVGAGGAILASSRTHAAALSKETRGLRCQNWDWNWLRSILKTNTLSNTSYKHTFVSHGAVYLYICVWHDTIFKLELEEILVTAHKGQ